MRSLGTECHRHCSCTGFEQSATEARRVIIGTDNSRGLDLVRCDDVGQFHEASRGLWVRRRGGIEDRLDASLSSKPESLNRRVDRDLERHETNIRASDQVLMGPARAKAAREMSAPGTKAAIASASRIAAC